MADLLGRLRTGLGERDAYDAVSQCSRCGYCEQACPTYVATGKEHFSPRGRNQLFRMMLEGRLADPAAAEEALSTCLLCGACTTACYAHVPTAEFALEGRRRIRGEGGHWLARLLLGLLRDDPRRLEFLMKAGFWAKRLGFDRLGAWVLPWFGLGALAEAAKDLEDPPRRFLHEELRERTDLRAAGARWLYFPPCGTRYLFPRVGRASLEVLDAGSGPGAFLDAGCCGLVAYNYGALEDARVLARRLIERAEASGAPADAPVVGDCSSCVAHMKDLPKLFLEDAGWRTRAERFSARVKDIIELMPAEMLRAPDAGCGIHSYSDSCRARHGQGVTDKPREALRAMCGERMTELPEAECCGGAWAFSSVHPGLSDELLRRKVAAAAAVQARTVATSSTSCLLQLARGFRKYYPEARVVHLAELAAQRLRAAQGGMAKGART